MKPHYEVYPIMMCLIELQGATFSSKYAFYFDVQQNPGYLDYFIFAVCSPTLSVSLSIHLFPLHCFCFTLTYVLGSNRRAINYFLLS